MSYWSEEGREGRDDEPSNKVLMIVLGRVEIGATGLRQDVTRLEKTW